MRLAGAQFLRLAGARVVRQEQFDGGRGFYTAFLLNFVNPIGDGLNHFTRALSRRGFFWGGFLLARSLVLLNYSYCFLF